MKLAPQGYGVAMRPNKQINPGVHQSGNAPGVKSRYTTSGLPSGSGDAGESSEAATPAQSPPVVNKYHGRASVAPSYDDSVADVAIELTHEEWVDPLDEDELDLTTISIDLRDEMRPAPPEGYYQRHFSKVPGHQLIA